MAEPLDPQVVLFAPVKGVRVEDDGTITPFGIFTRVTPLWPGTPVELDFTVFALLIGGIGDFTIGVQLIDPDGAIRFEESAALASSDRHRLFGLDWRVRAETGYGEHELRLVIDDRAAVISLPFLVDDA